jgi:hypothetical protein
MTDTLDNVIPLASSACGKTNSYVVGCQYLQQQMSYAACLHRIKTIDTGKFPSDWSVCDRAGHSCPARSMRREEELAGKSIYFRAREALKAASDAARKWFMPGEARAAVARPARGSRSGGSVLDALGEGGSFADAISAAAAAPATPSVPTPRPVIPIALAGETPLQMARRLKAERDAKATQAA